MTCKAETRRAAQWSAKTVSPRRKLKNYTKADLTRTHTHRHMKDISIKNKQTKKMGGTGEMAQQLRALAAAAEEPGSLVPSTRMLAHSDPYLQFQGLFHSLLSYMGPKHAHCAYT